MERIVLVMKDRIEGMALKTAMVNEGWAVDLFDDLVEAFNEAAGPVQAFFIDQPSSKGREDVIGKLPNRFPGAGRIQIVDGDEVLAAGEEDALGFDLVISKTEAVEI